VNEYLLNVSEYLLDRTVMQRYPLAADLYTLASRHERFPVAAIETMAGDLPLVATDAPHVPDILAENEQSGGLVAEIPFPVLSLTRMYRLSSS
jgi:glycosyltransferase involved in cell wall biosynthesis